MTYLYVCGEWIPIIESPRGLGLSQARDIMDAQARSTAMSRWVAENTEELLNRYECTCTVCRLPATCTGVGMKGSETLVYPICRPDGMCVGVVTQLLDEYVLSPKGSGGIAHDSPKGPERLTHLSMCMYCRRIQQTVRCGRCRLENYCSLRCEELDLPRHRSLCDRRVGD
jgi:hypothetical protein